MTYYDAISSGYDELYEKEQKEKMKAIEKLISPKQYEKLLDVGCGSGISSKWKCKVYGIDRSSELIDLAKKRVPWGRFRMGKAEDLPYDGGFFDYVICVTAIHNFDDIKKGLEEIRRVGKSKFVFSVMNKSDKKNRIIELIEELFHATKKINEEKDTIIFAQTEGDCN